MLRLRLISALALWFLLTLTCFAQGNQVQDLEALTNAEKQAREEAAALEKRRKVVSGEISDLQKSLQKLARETKVFEKDALALTARKDEIDANIAEITQDIKADEADLMKLLAALQRLETNPPPTLAIRPDDAIASAQAGQLMAALSKQLDQRTKALNVQLEALAQEQAQAEDTKKQIEANKRQLEKRRTRTLALVQDKSALQASIDTQRAEKQVIIDKLAAEAATLRDLLEKLQEEAMRIQPRVKPTPGRPGFVPPALPDGVRPFTQSKGRLSLPVSGNLKRRFGGNEKGLTFSAPSEGQVLAPYAGRVEFAGPFKNYDQVIILSVGEDHFILLTGLGQVFPQTGESIRQGDPVGLLPFNSSGSAELYLEFRRNGRTIDPSPWLAL